ncbi:MAG: helix-turn-helix domain-containing protein [Enterobacterales bacterium]|nr:helix-turn-helix domain-containing protein [Enterobacterales bacterium]
MNNYPLSKSQQIHHIPKVAILTCEQVSLFELACAVELFALERPEFETWYQTEVVTLNDSKSLHQKAAGNISIQCKNIKTLQGYDLLVIPSWPIYRSVDKQLATEIQHLYQSNARIISFCSGAFLLAEIGLLKQHSATTHWRYADQFKQRFPQINFKPDQLFVLDEKIGCSAGSSAAIDLGLEIIRQDFGYKIANQVARRLVLAAHRDGGQSQFVQAPIFKTKNQFSETLDWAVKNLDQALSVEQLATKANMSRRSFDRKFRAALNMSAKQWLIKQQIESAKQLLESTHYPIEKIANACGFETALSLRLHFKKQLDISPSQFRGQFLSKNRTKIS